MLQEVFQSAHSIQGQLFFCEVTRWQVFQVYYLVFCYTEKEGYQELVLLFQSIIAAYDIGYAVFIY